VGAVNGGGFWTGAWTLLVVVAAVAAVGPARQEERWTWVDGAILAAAALVYGVASTWILPPYHLALWPLTSSDFFQYCECVGALLQDDPAGFVTQRSWFAALLPAWYARSAGVIGGLALAAATSQFVLGAALWLWGRSVHGRFAGVACVLLALTLAPLVVLSRTVTFYPEAVAAYGVCAATAAAAARFRHPVAFAAAGGGITLALLVDVRGLYWALASLGVAGVAAVARPGRTTVANLALLLGPVVGSWWLARAHTDPTSPGLVRQTAKFVRHVQERLGHPPTVDEVVDQDFLWGREPPWEVPEALRLVAGLARSIPAGSQDVPEFAAALQIHVLPWALPVAVAAVLALAGLGVGAARRARRGWQLLALVGPLVPFVAAFPQAALVLTHPRYLAVAFAGLPVVLGVGLAVVGSREGQGLPERARLPVAGLLLLGFVSGVLPSWLSPVAGWRIPQTAEQFPREFQQGLGTVGPTEHRCRGYVDADEGAGRRWGGYPPPP